VAYYTEIKGSKNREVSDIEIFYDQIANYPDESSQPCSIEFVDFDTSNSIENVQSDTDDLESRKRIAEIIGLKALPKPDPNAIHQLDSFLAKKLPKGRLDSVELVNSVRQDWMENL
jgi:hypothetical protein